MYLFKFNSEQLSWNGGISTADIKVTHKYLQTICKKIPANMDSQLAIAGSTKIPNEMDTSIFLYE